MASEFKAFDNHKVILRKLVNKQEIEKILIKIYLTELYNQKANKPN